MLVSAFLGDNMAQHHKVQWILPEQWPDISAFPDRRHVLSLPVLYILSSAHCHAVSESCC